MENNLVDEKRKKRLIISRFCGIIVSFAIIGLLLAYYFTIIDQWIMVLCVVLLSGINFTINAAIIETKRTSNLTKMNLALSTIFFLIGCGFLIYGLVVGELVLF